MINIYKELFDGSYIPSEIRLKAAQEYFRVDNWDENKHPRDDKGRFTNRGSRGRINKKELKLPKEEYSKVMSELNSNLPKELKKKPVFYRAIGDFEYKVVNKGFNDYTIIEKRGINDIYD